METIALNMKKDPNFVAIWLESEGSIQLDYIINVFGIDPERFYYIEHERDGAAEKVLDLLESVLAAGVADIAVVNSLKCLVPSEEFKKSLNDTTIALQARMNSRMMKKFTAIVSEYQVAMVLITHLTTKIGSMSRDPLIVSGGQAIMYGASIIMDLRKHAISEADPIKKEEGIKVHVKVTKNHCVPDRNPYVQTDYYAIFGEGIEIYLTLIDKAVENGVLLKKGAFISDPDEEGNPKVVGEMKYQWQGNKRLRDYLIANEEYFEELKARVSGNFVKSLSEEEINEIKQDEKVVAKEVLKENLKENKKKSK